MLMCLPSISRIVFAWTLIATVTVSVEAQVRSKKPDRGTYEPVVNSSAESLAPVQQPVRFQTAPVPKLRAQVQTIRKQAKPLRQTMQSEGSPAKWGAPLVDATVPLPNQTKAPSKRAATATPRVVKRQVRVREAMPKQTATVAPAGVQITSPAPTILTTPNTPEVVAPQPPMTPSHPPAAPTVTPEIIVDEGIMPPMHTYADEDCACDQCAGDACDALACDSMGCDGGCGILGCGGGGDFWNLLPTDKLFGSVEVMLMFQRGDTLPALVTTGPSTDSETAGELGVAGTRVLFSDDQLYDDLTAGGRVELGAWLNSYRTQSLVLRGWIASEASDSFFANQSQFDVIGRPFSNATGQDPIEDVRLIAFPGQLDGSISIEGESTVYGVDISARQFYHGQYGGTIDLLYGYQYMKMERDLAIATQSLVLDGDLPPAGSTIAVSDVFDLENEFHGFEFGVATMYREKCWSFKSIMKVAAGLLTRRAVRNGSTLTSNEGVNALDPNGLLVRNTNSGIHEDDTFAWVPELDFTLGYHQFRNFDVTVGYHVIAMTDALMMAGAIDRTVNFDAPDSGVLRPTGNVSYETFYVQGIHFGIQYVH